MFGSVFISGSEILLKDLKNRKAKRKVINPNVNGMINSGTQIGSPNIVVLPIWASN